MESIAKLGNNAIHSAIYNAIPFLNYYSILKIYFERIKIRFFLFQLLITGARVNLTNACDCNCSRNRSLTSHCTWYINRFATCCTSCYLQCKCISLRYIHYKVIY